MASVLRDPGVSLPALAAPMAGGPSTSAMVVAAGRAGSLGSLAAGYKTTAARADELSAVQAVGVPFGVTLFAPNPVPVDQTEYRRYAESLRPDAEALGLDWEGRRRTPPLAVPACARRSPFRSSRRAALP